MIKAIFTGKDGENFLKSGLTYEIEAVKGRKDCMPVLFVTVTGDVLLNPTEIVYSAKCDLLADWKLLHGE